MNRNPVSSKQNIWYDSQQVDNSDLTLEQDHNDNVETAIIVDHIGSGVIPEVLVQNVIFDSSIFVGLIDGLAISPQAQPSDSNLGNQLEVVLEGSKATITKSVKLCIIGLDFESNLQYEIFYFKSNEIQVSKKHFTKVLTLLFNDLLGADNLSFNLGGTLIIKEAKSMSLSRDAIMVAQDIQPNLFFRDFFLNDTSSNLTALLTTALPFYNVDSLNIKTEVNDNKVLFVGDVTTQIGQKFIAKTNNIQKATLLLSVRNQELGSETDLGWTGDLIVSIYPLQSGLECPTDIAPNLLIDFSPSNIPIAQLSINYNTLLASGVVLDSIPQPIDFIFSNSSPAASGNTIVKDSYYAITIKRSGSADKCDILIATGANYLENSRITTFTGTLWVDLPEEDLWFKIWTDSAKISDGQAYESGHGIIIPKTIENENTTIDYSAEDYQFYGNDSFYAVISAKTEETVPVADQRTGSPVLTRKQFVPDVSLLNTLDYTNLGNTIDPFTIGIITDKNKKFIDSLSNIINTKLYSATIVKDQLFVRIVDDPTDTGRSDSSVSNLTTSLLNGDLVRAKIIPNFNNPSVYYRIGDVKLCSMIVGDSNGDGIVDNEDLDILSSYIGFNYNTGLPVNTVITTDGYSTTYTNGYNTYINNFVNNTGIVFQIVDPSDNSVDGYAIDGVLVADPNDSRLAQFGSTAITFGSISGIGDHNLVSFDSSNSGNYGGFEILAVDTINNVLTLRKIILTEDRFDEIFRSDIDEDFAISLNDQYLLRSYLDRDEVSSPATPPYPSPTTNAYDKIGTRFNVLKFKLEKFVDRTDDYNSVPSTRSTTVHTAPDVFLADGYFASHDFYTFPSTVVIEKQLSWDESLIVYKSDARLVPSIFNASGEVKPSCSIDGVECHSYPAPVEFNSDKIDFFIPNNLILDKEIIRPDGGLFKMDMEVGTIVLEIPDGYGTFNPEKTINIFSDFVFDYTGDGVTRLGFPAMRFADCSFVKSDALTKEQVRFSVAVQAFSPNTNGTDEDGYSGVIVDGKIGVYIDYSTGLLTLNFSNIFKDPVLRTLDTKIQISVFLKKAGFLNKPIVINPIQLKNLLDI